MKGKFHLQRFSSGAVALLIAALTLAMVFRTSAKSPAWLTENDDKIRNIIEKMTLQEKVGQMTQPDLGSIRDLSDIKSLCLGSVLSGGSTDPKTGNTRADWTRNYLECQTNALQTRLRIPLLYGIDAVHGHNNVLGAVIFPHNIGLGCSRNPALVEKVARITAREMRATGIQWTFAPCVTVPRDLRWGRTYEGFSEDPVTVENLGAAAVKGFQGASLSASDSVVACAKHFAGDGGTTFSEEPGRSLLDQGDTRVDEDTLRSIHLRPYRLAISEGVATIMPSYSSWNGVKCSGNKYLLTDVLKKELGFKGFLISDYNAIDQLVPPPSAEELQSDNASGQVKSRNYKKCIEISINAGMDMVMVTDRYKEYILLLTELVQEQKIPMSRIDDAVTRILRVKFAAGLMDGKVDPLKIDPALEKEFGSKAHRDVAREAVQKSLVLLKNKESLLPLNKPLKRIHVAGRAADDLGMQCGGWTIDWQGKTGKVTEGGTTILAAIRQEAGAKTEVTTSADGLNAKGADVGIVVVGEEPYAEMKGDRKDLGLSKQDLEAVRNVKEAGIPVIVVVLSGRPLVLGPVAEQADALVAAWLPGTEGQGVSDVLFGKARVSGRLSFFWPQSMAGVPQGHHKGPAEKALYPRGFGLEY